MRYNHFLGSVFLVLSVSSSIHGQSFNSFTIGSNFNGTQQNQSGFIPPDTMGSIGPNHYVELINGRFQRFSRAGASQQASSLNTFWSTALTAGGSGATLSGSAFDPRVMYDRQSGRWFATAVDALGDRSNSGILVGVTTGNDPTLANWRAFRLDADVNNFRWADYPTIGMNNNWVTITNNMFAVSSASASISVWTIPKASLTAVTPGITGNQYLVDATANPGTPLVNTHGFTLHPVYDYSNNAPTTGYLLSRFNNTFLQRSTLTGAVNTPMLTGSNFVSTSNRGMGDINAPQSGANDNIDAGDNRISGSPVLVNGKIWGVHSFDSGGLSRTVAYRINAATNALEYEGVIPISNSALWTYYPSIAVNSFGQIAVAFSGSDNSTFVSTYAIGGYFDGTNVTWGTEQLLQSGQANYLNLDGSSRNRWGDYSSMQVDPNDEFSFWTIQEFANATNSWQTRITQLNFAAVPEPITMSLIGLTTIGVCGRFYWTRRQRRKQLEVEVTD